MTNSVSNLSGANLEYVTIGFNNLAAGTVVGDQFEGVTIRAQRAEDGGIASTSENDAMIFDTANPTGGDRDLFTQDQGSALIISEDNDSSDPDDEAHGGDIQFTFDNPASVKDLNIIDAEHGGIIRAFDADGRLITSVEIPATGPDGQIRQFTVNAQDVSELLITFNNSGAVDDLRYLPGAEPQPVPASVGGTVFLDRNDDSLDNADDGDVEGVTVVLITNKGAEVGRTTTDAEGNYLFENVAPGTGYRVLFANVDGTTFVQKNVGNDDTIDSDVYAIEAGAKTARFDLAEGEDKRDVDAGVELIDTADASISGTYFMDNNDNSVEDAGDMAVTDATVSLIADGQVVATTTTDADGNYSFEGLTAGTYQVRFDAQNDKIFVDANAGSDEAADSDVTELELGNDQNVEAGLTNTVALSIGEHRPNVDAGVESPAPITGALEGRVFCDTDGDGIDNHGTTTVTGEELIVNGDFAIHGIGNKGWDLAKSIEGWTATTGAVEVQQRNYGTGNEIGNEVVELDARFNSTIEQTVVLPETGTYQFSIDYAMRGTNPDTNGVEVYIGGELVAALFPTERGFQTFEINLDLPAGETQLEIKGAGVSDSIGTVIDNVSLKQTTTTTASMGKEGVEVKLLDMNGDVVATTVTDADGNYRFDDVVEGDYQVMVTALDGMEFTLQDAGTDDTIDSDVDADGMTGKVTVVGGETTSDVDAGLIDIELASVGGTVFMDNNDNSVEDAGDMSQAGVEVILSLNGAEVARTTTDADGNYLFEDVTPAEGYSVFFADVAGKTFVDTDAGMDDTIDSDATVIAGGASTASFDLAAGEDKRDLDAGVEVVDTGDAALEGRVFMDVNDDSVDNDEMGVSGVEVTLLTAAGAIVATTTTAADGSYAFEGLDAGRYSVQFPTEFDGKTLVDANVGTNNAIDSDAATNNGITDVVNLGIGDRVTDVDAGLELVDTGDAALEGRVFMDVNGDAIDNNEMGVGGVVVDLLDADGELVDTTLTNDDGSYAFEGLQAGDYIVDFPVEVDGKAIVAQNAGSDDTIDSDASETSGRTGIISLAIGERSIDNDAGFETVDNGTASLAGRIFLDANQDDIDNAEEGVAGVTVTLRDADGNVVATTETRESGSYEFTGLLAGDYVVDFPTEVDGLTLVGQNAGSDDAVDSDASQADGRTGVISLAIGERSIDNDAGLELVDPANASLAGRVFFDANQDDVDNGEAGVGDVVVDLLDADGELVDTTLTAADGSYAFTNLAAGDYIVDFPVEVDGLTIVAQNAGANDAIDSDASETTGLTDVISLAIGEQSIDNDAGLELVDTADASLAGRVFLDANDNKVDNAEEGVGGVPVQLFNAAGAVIAETTTASNGSYSFTGLTAGTYSVGFPTELDGKKLVGSNAGSNDAIDSDANTSTGRTANVDIAIGEAVTDVDAGLVSLDPIVGNDSGKICADKKLTLNVLSNDTDVEALTITEVGGKAISDGQTVTINGVRVTLNDDKLTFDGKSAFEDLNVGEEGTARISYTVSDGNGGEATANVDLTFCGVADTLVEMHASLPEVASFQVMGDDLDDTIEGDAYSIILNNTGDARFDGKLFEQAYCISLLDPVVYAEVAKDSPSYQGEISGGDEFVFNADQVSFANGKSAGENLDLINWIINQDYSNENPGRFNDWEVQRAIWELTDAFDTSVLDSVDINYGQDADVDWIVQQAIRNGEGFEAGKGDIATMIVDPGDSNAEHTQPFIIAFDFDDNDCIC